MIRDEFYSEIYNKFGAIKRARGFFLYTEKGDRLTDMYLENGRAILGWGNNNGENGNSSFLRFKNVINRGLTGSFITSFSDSLDKAVSDLLDADCKAYIFYDLAKAKKMASSLSSKFVRYVPWIGLVRHNKIVPDFECALIVPPFPWTENIYILAVRDDITVMFFDEYISGALESALARSIYDLIAELPHREEKDWFLYDSILQNYFERHGPYLIPKMSKEKYDDFVNHCLSCQLVISPNYEVPSIVPFGVDKGVFNLLKKSPWTNF